MIEDWSQRIDELGARLRLCWQTGMKQRQSRVQGLHDGLNSRALQQRCTGLTSRVDAYRRELGLLMVRKLDRIKHDLSRAEKGLEALDPGAPLKRGYSLTRLIPGLELVTRNDDVTSGDYVQVLLAKGHLVCQVEQSSPEKPGVAIYDLKHTGRKEQS